MQCGRSWLPLIPCKGHFLHVEVVGEVAKAIASNVSWDSAASVHTALSDPVLEPQDVTLPGFENVRLKETSVCVYSNELLNGNYNFT